MLFSGVEEMPSRVIGIGHTTLVFIKPYLYIFVLNDTDK